MAGARALGPAILGVEGVSLSFGGVKAITDVSFEVREREIFAIIGEINRAGTTVLLVEQNANMALHIAARACVLETGRIALGGTAHELLDDRRVRDAYLGA